MYKIFDVVTRLVAKIVAKFIMCDVTVNNRLLIGIKE